MLTDEQKEQLLEALDWLPGDIQGGLFKTITRQAEQYKGVAKRKPELQLVVNGAAHTRGRR